jgi:hypothetical protein
MIKAKDKTEKIEVIKEIVPVAPEMALEKPTGIVAPIVSPQEALANWKAFQDLKKSLLDGSDYQAISQSKLINGQWVSEKKSFIKKSGWRKLATAFNLSDEIVKEERKDYPDMEYKTKVGQDVKIEKKAGFVIEATAKATAMNGRYATGVGSCSSNERGFAHLEHDVRSMAHTRAKNRAISDLIGGGEVSSDEIVDVGFDQQKTTAPVFTKPVATAPTSTTTTAEEDCPIDHNTLAWQVVKKEGKNQGRSFKTCPTCKMFKWKKEENE